MASRKELKEKRRREREEAARRAEHQKRRRRRLRLLASAAAAIAVLGAGAAFVLLGGARDDPNGDFAAKPEGLQERVQKARLTLGADHFHPTVRVVANGEDIRIPDNIGAAAGGAHAPIHRHPGDEQLHAEGLEQGRFTLGQFMEVWGVPLSATRLGPFRAAGRRKVMVLAKPKGAERFRRVRDIDGLQLRDGDDVYIVYGTAEQSPVVP